MSTISTDEARSLYAALLVYESSSSAPDYQALYEETITLLFAGSEAEAAIKAKQHGAGRATSYENAAGETITWTLKHVVDVSAVADTIDDGAEIYTRHFRNYTAYRDFETRLDNRGL